MSKLVSYLFDDALETKSKKQARMTKSTTNTQSNYLFDIKHNSNDKCNKKNKHESRKKINRLRNDTSMREVDLNIQTLEMDNNCENNLDSSSESEYYYLPEEKEYVYDREIYDEFVDDDIGPNEKRLTKILDGLLNIEYPEQRSPAWFKLRNEKITASDGGCVLGDNHLEKPYKFILKKCNNPPFESSAACYHGTKYEEIATKIYEYRMNVDIKEFGLIGHPQYDFLGASPDGIVGRNKSDCKHLTKYVGRMLEIKCPKSRVINMDGDIKGHICPIYYWDQVQLQLECCDLDECDFWQCSIKEYNTRESFLADTDPKSPFKSKSFGYEKGCIIQLLPQSDFKNMTKLEYDKFVWGNASWIYPPKIEMTPHECDMWILDTLDKIITSPEYSYIDNTNGILKRKIFDRVLYWRLEASKNVTIMRDKEWFKETLPKMQKMWDYVIFFRNNPSEMDLLNRYINSMILKKNKKIMEVVDMIYGSNDIEKTNLEIENDIIENSKRREELLEQKRVAYNENKKRASEYSTYLFD